LSDEDLLEPLLEAMAVSRMNKVGILTASFHFVRGLSISALGIGRSARNE
jgi:hypothetical protein